MLGCRGLEVVFHGGPKGDGDGRIGGDQSILDGVAGGFDDHGAAADHSTRPVARVHGCYAKLANPFHQRIRSIVGVNRSQLGLNRVGCFQLILISNLTRSTAINARDAVGGADVDEARRDNLGFEHGDAIGQPHAIFPAYPGDFAVPDQDGAIFDGRSGGGVDELGSNQQVIGLRRRRDDCNQQWRPVRRKVCRGLSLCASEIMVMGVGSIGVIAASREAPMLRV